MGIQSPLILQYAKTAHVVTLAHIYGNTKPGVHVGGNLYWDLLGGAGLVSAVSC